MARFDLRQAQVWRDQLDAALGVTWTNQYGDWFGVGGIAQGTTPYASASVVDTDTPREITFDVTALAQIWFAEPDRSTFVFFNGGVAFGGAYFELLNATNPAHRPRISYNGGADIEATDCLQLNSASAGASLTGPLPLSNNLSSPPWSRLIAEFPAPTAAVSSATIKLWTSSQVGDQTVDLFLGRAPGETAPTGGGGATTPIITSNGGGVSASLSVAENTTTVTTVAATGGGTMVYSISGADAGDFSINSASGVLVFSPAPDFEAPGDADTNNVYLVTVTATNSAGSDSQDLTVTVTDVADLGPDAVLNMALVYRGALSATIRGDIAQTGVPAVSFNCEYRVVGAPSWTILTDLSVDTTAQQVSAHLGALSPGEQYEARIVGISATAQSGNYSTLVQWYADTILSGGGEPTTGLVAPEIANFSGAASASANLPENAASGTVIAAYSATGTAPLVWSIGGADASQFAIDSSSGVLTTAFVPNFEAPADADLNNAYQISVTAQNGAGTDVQLLTINVTNIAEGGPVITSPPTFSVTEENTLVATLVASDPDNDPITWAITGGADQARFVIGASSGALSFASAPNFEAPSDADANNIYLLQVTATANGQTASQSITVTVTDAPEVVTSIHLVEPVSGLIRGRPGIPVRLRVVDQASRAVMGATVAAQPGATYAPNDPTVYIGTTDAEGYCIWANPPLGTFVGVAFFDNGL